LQRVEGPITAAFPVLVPPVTEIRAMTLAPDETTVYCWDSEGRGFEVDSETGIATALSADLAAGETAQHATHEDDAPIVYLATFGATEGTTYKYLPLIPSAGLLNFYTPASGQQAHRIGIGEPVVVRGTVSVEPLGGEGGGASSAGRPPSVLVRAANAPGGVAWVDDEGEVDSGGVELVNAGPEEWEAVVVQVFV
jgi:hypothetical protein